MKTIKNMILSAGRLSFVSTYGREVMAILSEAVVTRDTVPGLKQYDNCL